MTRLPRKHATPQRQRLGFSLIEVILATAILMGSVVVLGELAGIGRRQAQRGRDLAEAHDRCELLLNELLLGQRPLTPAEQEPLLEQIDVSEQADIEFGKELFDESDPFAPREDERDALTTGSTLTDEETDWLYSLYVEPLSERPGLALLRVSVEQSPEKFPRPVSFVLSRWIEDPSPVDESELESANGPRVFTATQGGQFP